MRINAAVVNVEMPHHIIVVFFFFVVLCVCVSDVVLNGVTNGMQKQDDEFRQKRPFVLSFPAFLSSFLPFVSQGISSPLCERRAEDVFSSFSLSPVLFVE